jgi:hypothetical protein
MGRSSRKSENKQASTETTNNSGLVGFQEGVIVEILAMVETELRYAIKKHGYFYDYHHGLGVMLEEVRELETEIFRKDDWQNPHRIKAEAIQVAAMATKIALLANKSIESRGIGSLRPARV